MQSLALRRFLFAALSASPLMLLAATTLPAQAARSLTFTFPRLSNGSVISAGYGDIPNALSTEFSCEDGSRARYWKDDYSNLDGVAYGCSSSSTEIVFKPEPGYSLKLLGLDFGAYSSDRDSKLRISEGSTVLLEEDPMQALISQRKSYDFDSISIAGGSELAISWGPDSYNVGIDNIRFQLIGVPAPLSLAGALGAFHWSRRLRSRTRL